jgi:hypothetical protein
MRAARAVSPRSHSERAMLGPSSGQRLPTGYISALYEATTTTADPSST